MKWNVILGSIVLSVALCSQSFGFELLNRMLGIQNGCCNSCCTTPCCQTDCCATGCCATGCCDNGCCDTGCCDTGCASNCCTTGGSCGVLCCPPPQVFAYEECHVEKAAPRRCSLVSSLLSHKRCGGCGPTPCGDGIVVTHKTHYYMSHPCCPDNCKKCGLLGGILHGHHKKPCAKSCTYPVYYESPKDCGNGHAANGNGYLAPVEEGQPVPAAPQENNGLIN